MSQLSTSRAIKKNHQKKARLVHFSRTTRSTLHKREKLFLKHVSVSAVMLDVSGGDVSGCGSCGRESGEGRK